MVDEKVTIQFTVKKDTIDRVLEFERREIEPVWDLFEDVQDIVLTFEKNDALTRKELGKRADVKTDNLLNADFMDAMVVIGFLDRDNENHFILGPALND